MRDRHNRSESKNLIIDQLAKVVSMEHTLVEASDDREKVFREMGQRCGKICQMRLLDDLDANNELDRQDQLLIERSDLEVCLRQVMNRSSRFWEHYYSRRQNAAIEHPNVFGSSWNELSISRAARYSYPEAYLPLDALFFCQFMSRSTYELRLQSTVCFIQGQLSLLHEAGSPNDDFRKALTLLSGEGESMYRKLLVELISKQ